MLVVDGSKTSGREEVLYDSELILTKINTSNSLCLIFKKSSLHLKKREVGHSSDVQAFLSTIGPLVNNNFEFESIRGSTFKLHQK